jgi:putative peptidoglycan lipid II flippase
VKITSPVFYAMHDGRTPVVVSAVSVLTNAGLNLLLVGRFGYAGLAAGTSVTAVLNAALLLDILRRRLGGLEAGRLLDAAVRVVAASIVMGAAVVAIEWWLERLMPGAGLAARTVRVAIPIACGLGVLVLAAHVVRLREMSAVLRAIVGAPAADVPGFGRDLSTGR